MGWGLHVSDGKSLLVDLSVSGDCIVPVVCEQEVGTPASLATTSISLKNKELFVQHST